MTLTTYQYQGMDMLAFEASLPRRANGTNVNLLSLDQTRQQVLDLHTWLSRFVEWRSDWSDLRVLRLDVGRDFTGVTALPYLLPAFAAMPVRWERNSPAVWSDPERGYAQTLTRGSRNGVRVSLYNKHAEVKHRLLRAGCRSGDLARHADFVASRDVARFEAQCRATYLARFGISHVSDINEETVTTMRRTAFDDHHLGLPVVPGLELVRRMRADGMTEARQAGVFFHAFLLSNGLTPQADRGTQAARRRDLERLGVVPGDLLQPAPSAWLDFDAGCQRTDADLN